MDANIDTELENSETYALVQQARADFVERMKITRKFDGFDYWIAVFNRVAAFAETMQPLTPDVPYERVQDAHDEALRLVSLAMSVEKYAETSEEDYHLFRGPFVKAVSGAVDRFLREATVLSYRHLTGNW